MLQGAIMSDGKPAPQNIQDAFLNTVRREKAAVVIYLLNGAKLTGRIRSFDKFCLRRDRTNSWSSNTPSQQSLCQDVEAEIYETLAASAPARENTHDNLLRKPPSSLATRPNPNIPLNSWPAYRESK